MNRIADWIASHEAELTDIAHDIFCHPELAYEEIYSSKRLASFLENQGFQITWKTAGIDTAFTATWGNGSPRLGFLAEYDALPEIGHACGHNLLGTGVCAAACALKNDMETSKTCGTILVYGCPAEEIMSGKIVMTKAGVFDDLDVAVMWHPFDRNRISNDIWQAQDVKNYTFHGVSAHASRSPEEGRSALDAAELMNIGVNYLREHVPGDVRMHYAYIDNHIPANVVPDTAKTNYFIRSSLRSRTEDASRRVDDCARGAALMTGTSVDIELVKSCREMRINRALTELYYEAMTKIDTPTYTQEELDFGSKAFSGVSPPIPGVLYSFTSLFRRTPYFPGVSLNLLVFLVFTRFYWSSPLFAGVPYLNHQIFFKLHQLFLKLPITFIAMLDASMVAPYFQCYD